jgi:hypothetical protein
MVDFYQFDSRFKSMRGGWGSLPPAARFIVGLFALPGILLAILSLILFAVSMLALLVLTVPVYRLLVRLTGGGRRVSVRTGESAAAVVINPFFAVLDTPPGSSGEVPSSGTRRVDSTVVE